MPLDETNIYVKRNSQASFFLSFFFSNNNIHYIHLADRNVVISINYFHSFDHSDDDS